MKALASLALSRRARFGGPVPSPNDLMAFHQTRPFRKRVVFIDEVEALARSRQGRGADTSEASKNTVAAQLGNEVGFSTVAGMARRLRMVGSLM
ncbi:MAG: AAA family ATPase [Verrucomicrobia bacterium]|nr:MAG: AAA family ATPase [Verrucomicrobiota bacterium]